MLGGRLLDPASTEPAERRLLNIVEEMVNMISASRSYQNNDEVMNTAKTLLLKTLQMGQ